MGRVRRGPGPGVGLEAGSRRRIAQSGGSWKSGLWPFLFLEFRAAVFRTRRAAEVNFLVPDQSACVELAACGPSPLRPAAGSPHPCGAALTRRAAGLSSRGGEEASSGQTSTLHSERHAHSRPKPWEVFFSLGWWSSVGVFVCFVWVRFQPRTLCGRVVCAGGLEGAKHWEVFNPD